MPLLYDKKRGKVVNVADNLVNEALGTGNYEFRKGIEVPVIAPDGQEGTVLSDELPSLVGQGFQYLTAEEGKKRAKEEISAIKKETYGDMTGTAFLAGAARGATLGLSDVALRVGGLQEAALAVQQESPTASMLGEITGGVGALATPMLGAPAKAAMQAGEAAGGLIKGAGVGAKLARAGAAGVTEGALVGAGQTISEAALGDPNLTVEKAIGNIGLGAALGGGLNVAGRGALEVSNKAITGALSAMAKSEAIPKTAQELAGRLSEIYGRAVGLARGDFVLDDQVKDFWSRANKEGRKEAVQHMANPNELFRKIASNFDEVRNFSDELEKSASKAAQLQKEIIDENLGKITPSKIEYLDDDIAEELGNEYIFTRPTLKGTSLEVAEKKAGFKKFDDAQFKAQTLVKQIDDTVSMMQEANQKFGTVYEPGAIRELRILTEDLSKTVTTSTKISQINDAIVAAKNELARNAEIFAKPTALMTRVETDTKEALLPIWKSLKEASTDKELFGDLGAAVADRANILAQIKGATEQFDKQFFTYVKNGGKWERIEDYGKIAQFFKNTELPSKEKKRLALANFNTAIDESIEKLKPIPLKQIDDELANLEKVKKSIVNQKQVENKEQKIAFLERKIARIEKQNQKIQAFNDEIAKTIQDAKARKAQFDKAIDVAETQRAAVLMLNNQESMTGKSLHGTIIGGTLGGTLSLLAGNDPTTNALFGGIGVGVGAMLANPRSGLKFISGMENAAQGLDRMAQNAARRFKNIDRALKAQEGKLKSGVGAARQQFIREKLKIESDTQENNEKAYLKHMDDLNGLQQNPLTLYERIHDNVGDDAAEFAPVTTMTMFHITQRALAFLESKIPKDPYQQGVYPDKFVPSFVELDRYANYSQAVMRPKTIFKELEQGQLKPETVEAVKAVYPAVYDAAVQAVTAELVDSKKIDYDKRVQLGILFQLPSVKALQPDYLNRMMQIHSQAASQEQAQQQKLGTSQMVSFRGFKASEREQRNA